MRLLAALTVLLAAWVALAGCGSEQEGDDVASASAADAALEQQRTEVRELTRSLVAAAEPAVGATVREADARWEGCRSAYAETYASYRYTAQVRLDAASSGSSGSSDLLGALAPVVTEAGLSPGTSAGSEEPDKLRATRGDLEVSFWALPADSQGALLLTVRGPCVEVAEDERDAWRDRREEQPDPLQG